MGIVATIFFASLAVLVLALCVLGLAWVVDQITRR